jgi:hypothetical protein
VPLRSTEASASEGRMAGFPLGWSSDLAAETVDGSTAAGQTAEQSALQNCSQQPMAWCACIWPRDVIGQSCDAAANAGPVDIDRASASQMKANRRRMPMNYSKGSAGGNYVKRLRCCRALSQVKSCRHMVRKSSQKPVTASQAIAKPTVMISGWLKLDLSE